MIALLTIYSITSHHLKKSVEVVRNDKIDSKEILKKKV